MHTSLLHADVNLLLRMVVEQETLVILLDVSHGMHPYLLVALKCIATLVHRKASQSVIFMEFAF